MSVLVLFVMIVADASLGIESSMINMATPGNINPDYLVPGNVTAILRVTEDNTSLLLYDKNNSFGGIIPFGLSTLFLDRGESLRKLNSTNIHISQYESYMSTSIYRVEGISLVSASRGIIDIISAFNAGKLNSTTGYISDSIGGNTVAGNLSDVRDSIASAHIKKLNPMVSSLNTSSMYSLVFNYNTSLMKAVWVNSTNNYTSLHVLFTSNVSETDFINAYNLLLYDFVIFPIPMNKLPGHELGISLSMNMYQFILFISSYWQIWNKYAGGFS